MKPIYCVIACFALSLGASNTTSAQEAAKAPPQAASPAPNAEQAFVVRQQVDRIRYEADGTRVRHVSRDVRIQNAAGLEAWRDVTMWYSADRERLALIRLEIVKPSGERVRPQNLTLEDRRQSGVFDQKVFGDVVEGHVTVPSLAVGDELSYEIRIDTTTPESGGAIWVAHTFHAASPMDEEILQIEVPTEVPVTVWTRPGQNGPESDEVEGAHRVLRWRRTGYRPPPPAKEPTIEDALTAEEAPGADVHVSSLVSWRDVGGWYRNVLDKVDGPGPSVAAKARELTAFAATEEEKLRALYRFVASDVHYVSLAFGVGRHQPRAPDLVLQTGYGDCKDKHTLLAALAREIGVTLDPVLLGSSTKLDEAAPSPGQFDHLISVWRRNQDPDQWLWLDSTSGLTGAGVLLPHLRAKQALLVDAAGTSHIVTTSKVHPASRLTVTLTGTLEADGAQAVTVRRLADGDQGVLFRVLRVALQDAEQVKQAAASLLEDDGISSSKVTTASLDVPPAFDSTADLTYTAHVTYDLASTVKKQAMWIPASRVWLPDPDKLPTPWRLPFEGDAQYQITTNYTLPETWGAEAPVDVDLTMPFGRYRSRYVVQGRQLSIERHLEISGGVLTEEHRAAYTRFRTSVIEDRAQVFGLKVPSATLPVADETEDLFSSARKALEARRFAQARDLLLKLTAAEPDHSHAWNELGRAYLALQEFEPARVALEKQGEIDPLHAFAYTNLGNAHWGLGNHADAEAAFRKQIAIVPLDKWAHRSLGLLLLDMERPQEAVASLERAVALARDDQMSRLQLGRAYLAVNQPARALEIFEEFAAMDPPNPMQINAAAFRLAEAGVELPRARGWIERVLALAHGSIGSATMEQMRDSNLRPVNGAMHLWGTLGWVAFKQGDMPAARLWLEAAHAWSDNIDIALHVAVLREKEGRPVGALAAYRRATNGPSIPASVDATIRKSAADAIARLEKDGRLAQHDLEAADLRSRQSTLTVSRLASAATGEVLVSIGTEGTIDDVLVLGQASALAPVADALKGTAVPGADIARVRQLRLFRKAAVDCSASGTCTIVWHRIP